MHKHTLPLRAYCVHAHAQSDWFFWAHCGPRVNKNTQKVLLRRVQTQQSYSCLEFAINTCTHPYYSENMTFWGYVHVLLADIEGL